MRVVRDRRAELQAWYLHGLRRKLIQAARAGSVSRSAAEDLDRKLCECLDITREPAQEAA
jgi:hypothetical protein